jgi:hypothetical protein
MYMTGFGNTSHTTRTSGDRLAGRNMCCVKGKQTFRLLHHQSKHKDRFNAIVWQEKTLKMTKLYKDGEISKTVIQATYGYKQTDQFNHTISRIRHSTLQQNKCSHRYNKWLARRNDGHKATLIGVYALRMQRNIGRTGSSIRTNGLQTQQNNRNELTTMTNQNYYKFVNDFFLSEIPVTLTEISRTVPHKLLINLLYDTTCNLKHGMP